MPPPELIFEGVLEWVQEVDLGGMGGAPTLLRTEVRNGEMGWVEHSH